MAEKLNLVPSEVPPDPFDLEALRLKPNFIETAGVKKLLSTVPVRKPHPQEFVRVHPGPEMRGNFLMLDLKEDREEFLVMPNLIGELNDECVMKTLFTAISRQGVCFLWPVRLPRPDDRANEWARSAREAAELATTSWVRFKANMALGAYDISLAEAKVADPVWPELGFKELIRIAFRERIIDATDHSIIKRLRGLA